MMKVEWRPECRWHECRVADGILPTKLLTQTVCQMTTRQLIQNVTLQLNNQIRHVTTRFSSAVLLGHIFSTD